MCIRDRGALQQAVGAWAGPFLTVVIFFLAWSSVLGNTYYGEANIQYLAGDRAPAFITAFRVLVLLCVVGGALGTVNLVWNLADTFAALMATINLVAIIPLGGLAVKLLKDYERKLKAGEDPQFRVSDLPEAKNVPLWRDGETELMRTVPGAGSPEELHQQGLPLRRPRGGSGSGSGSSVRD